MKLHIGANANCHSTNTPVNHINHLIQIKFSFYDILGLQLSTLFETMTTNIPMSIEALRLALNNLEKNGMLAGEAQFQTEEGKVVTSFRLEPDAAAPGGARVVLMTAD